MTEQDRETVRRIVGIPMPPSIEHELRQAVDDAGAEDDASMAEVICHHVVEVTDECPGRAQTIDGPGLVFVDCELTEECGPKFCVSGLVFDWLADATDTPPDEWLARATDWYEELNPETTP